MRFNSTYLMNVYESPKEYAQIVKRVARGIRTLRNDLKFDAIAFRGTSGAAMAYPISAMLQIPLLSCRKDKNHHAAHMVEGSYATDVKKYVILDDFIASGDTVAKIMDLILNYGYDNDKPQCVGVLLWNKKHYDWPSKPTVHGVKVYKL